MTTLEILQHKLNYLRETVDFNKNMEVFNDKNGNADLLAVRHHRYQLGPCLTEAEVIAVEQQYRIRLPEDYREFLLNIGNGGAGPDSGMGSLSGSIETAKLKCPDLADDVLAKPFPLVKPYVFPLDGTSDEVEAFLKDLWRPEYMQGTLPLADCGCGVDVLLIITGEARGTLWLDDRCNDSGIWPLYVVDGKIDHTIGCAAGHHRADTSALQPCDFNVWYDVWLDERIDIHARYKRGEWKSPWG
jgi:hypothetical protein